MKIFSTLLVIGLSVTLLNAQSVSSTNSGAVSTNNLIYSVGEIYVLPVNQNESSSGIIGAISAIEFNPLSIDEVIILDHVKFYPNPTSNKVFLETKNHLITGISIYDITGRLIVAKSIENGSIDISNLQAGTYFLKPNNIQVNPIKIVKQ